MAEIYPGKTVANFKIKRFSTCGFFVGKRSEVKCEVECEVMCSGFVKRDGCCEVDIGDEYLGEDDRTWHFCGMWEMTEFFSSVLRLRSLIMSYISDAVLIEEMINGDEDVC